MREFVSECEAEQGCVFRQECYARAVGLPQQCPGTVRQIEAPIAFIGDIEIVEDASR